MTGRCRLLAPLLLCDLSLTSSRHLGRLFTHSEAPFWTARNQCRFRLLHSDYPLYFTSFECPGLNPNRRADRSLLPLRAERLRRGKPISVGRWLRTLAWPVSCALFILSVVAFEALNEKTLIVGIHSALRWLLSLSSFMDTTDSLQAVAVVVASRVPMFLGALGFPAYGGCCFPRGFSSDLVTEKFSSAPAILQSLSASKCLLLPVSTELDNHNFLRKENIHAAQSRTFTI
jgi:hypothetical protein